jgi:CTP synthase
MLSIEGSKIKYIFVTGGVVSGIGKGICAAAIGYILKSSGLKVTALKMDPYLNVDPGTMSPYEHGEVFVLADGQETDLDLGNYERFLDVKLDKSCSVSSGQIYADIIKNEREGLYLGKTVQIIPHVTNYIQEKYKTINDDSEFKIIEIGGSTGDIEAEVFLESLRQFKVSNPNQVLHIHLGYLPFLKVVGEYKSKPLQNSIKELLRLGLQPDVIALRYEEQEQTQLTFSLISKIALSCNTQAKQIIQMPDLESIYMSPKHLRDQTNIVEILSEFAESKLVPNFNKYFENVGLKYERTVKIALIAKYSGLSDSYLSVIESIKIASAYNNVESIVDILDSETDDLLERMKGYDGFIVPGGFGNRGLEQKIKAIEYIRTSKKPFLGICLGMQMAVIEYLRNVCDIPNASSSEMTDTKNPRNCIDLMPDQLKLKKLGATMRLGEYKCELVKNSLAHRVFEKTEIIERHRHRLEVQDWAIPIIEETGMKVSGKHKLDNGFLVEIIELDTKVHPYFIAIQSHPEFLSRPDKPHPLFDGLLKSIINTLTYV